MEKRDRNNEFKYNEIYIDIKTKIKNKIYKLNDKLEKEIDLMKKYDVSRDTIRKALLKLQYEGYIRKVKGVGSFVNSLKTSYTFSNMLSFSEIILNQNGIPNSIVISAKLINTPTHIKDILTTKDNKVYKIERIRRNGEINLCYEITYISTDLCKEIDNFVTPNTSLFNLYEKKYALKLGNGSYTLEARTSDKEISKLLDIDINSPILYMEASIFTEDNKPLYLVEAHYIGSRYVFNINLHR